MGLQKKKKKSDMTHNFLVSTPCIACAGVISWLLFLKAQVDEYVQVNLQENV
jgi:hypothetical protein